MLVRGLVVLTLLGAPAASGNNAQLLSQLPGGAVSTAVQLDAAGNIYVAGWVAPASIHDSQDAFVAKVSADGSQLLYMTVVAGSLPDAATALALDPDGSAYVAGVTSSADFPVTPGAFQTTYQRTGQNTGFLVKVNPAGTVTYSTFINGSGITQITGMALGSGGEVFLTGVGGPASPINNAQSIQGFVLKLDSTMTKVLLSVYGWGGGLIQPDSQGTLYLAGSAQPNVTFGSTGITLSLPSLPGSGFQSTHDARFCLTLGSGPGGPGGSYPCRYQYVAKLGPQGTALWATYITGTYGATARGMAVDGAGNVTVAGTTNSDDYPVTAGAFQTAYAPAAPPFPVPPGSSYRDPPPATGFVSKLNSTGTALMWSTYFGGSFTDRITGMAISPAGDIVVSGRAGSSDLPALAGFPQGCRPSSTQELGFVARLAPDGATAGPTQVVTGAPDCAHLTCPILADYTNYLASWPLALRPDGTALTAGTNGTLASADTRSSSRVACVTDAADNVQLRNVAPGQLIAVFGTDLAPALPFTPAGGVAPSTANFGVFFNGVAAPILYSAGQQVNVQAPYEIAGQSTAQMQIVDQQVPAALSETHTFGVADRDPSVYLAPTAWTSPFPGYVQCGGILATGEPALALNADGTRNDCANPAPAGTLVTVFVNGLGQTEPALATGAVASPPATTLMPGVDLLDPNLSPIAAVTASIPGTLSGVAQVQFPAPPVAASPAPVAITPRVLGKNLRERLFLIWVRPN